MRLIRHILSAIGLVGCLVAAVAMAGEREGVIEPCEGPYAHRTPTPEELATILSNHRAWLESRGGPDDQRRANLCQAVLASANLQGAQLDRVNLQEAILFGADLQGARLIEANLQKAQLFEANLRGAELFEANLQGAVLMKTDLQGARLIEANLQGAVLFRANLQGAELLEANLQGASLIRANLHGVIYEPHPEKLPSFWTLTHPHNHLDTLVFRNSPAALIALREAFKKGGMRTQERQITYAIEHTKRPQAWDQWKKPVEQQEDARSWLEKLLGKEDTRPWPERLVGKTESAFSYVLFELPSHYGMAPGRALWGLLGLIPIFALPYWMAIKHANRRSGLWMIVPADRIPRGRGRERVVLLRPPMAKTWRRRLAGEACMLRTGLYFSLLSAFHLGWRELNVGT